jgi:hypothetical protein
MRSTLVNTSILNHEGKSQIIMMLNRLPTIELVEVTRSDALTTSSWAEGGG